MKQVAGLREPGISADVAARRMNLTVHKDHFPDIQEICADLRGVRRFYQWMDDSERAP